MQAAASEKGCMCSCRGERTHASRRGCSSSECDDGCHDIAPAEMPGRCKANRMGEQAEKRKHRVRSTTEYCGVLRSTAEYCGVLRSTAEYARTCFSRSQRCRSAPALYQRRMDRIAGRRRCPLGHRASCARWCSAGSRLWSVAEQMQYASQTSEPEGLNFTAPSRAWHVQESMQRGGQCEWRPAHEPAVTDLRTSAVRTANRPTSPALLHRIPPLQPAVPPPQRARPQQ